MREEGGGKGERGEKREDGGERRKKGEDLLRRFCATYKAKNRRAMGMQERLSSSSAANLTGCKERAGDKQTRSDLAIREGALMGGTSISVCMAT